MGLDARLNITQKKIEKLEAILATQQDIPQRIQDIAAQGELNLLLEEINGHLSRFDSLYVLGKLLTHVYTASPSLTAIANYFTNEVLPKGAAILQKRLADLNTEKIILEEVQSLVDNSEVELEDSEDSLSKALYEKLISRERIIALQKSIKESIEETELEEDIGEELWLRFDRILSDAVSYVTRVNRLRINTSPNNNVDAASSSCSHPTRNYWGKSRTDDSGNPIAPDRTISITHGGGLLHILNFLEGKSNGYRLERGSALGIQVHPYADEVDEHFRLRTYADRAEGYLDYPAGLIATIPAKYVEPANNGYEGGITHFFHDQFKTVKIKMFKSGCGCTPSNEVLLRVHRITGNASFIQDLPKSALTSYFNYLTIQATTDPNNIETRMIDEVQSLVHEHERAMHDLAQKEIFNERAMRDLAQKEIFTDTLIGYKKSLQTRHGEEFFYREKTFLDKGRDIDKAVELANNNTPLTEVIDFLNLSSITEHSFFGRMAHDSWLRRYTNGIHGEALVANLRTQINEPSASRNLAKR